MLVLTRKPDEEIVIKYGDVYIATITVLEVQRNRVKIGLVGDDATFVRGELANRERQDA